MAGFIELGVYRSSLLGASTLKKLILKSMLVNVLICLG